MRLASLYEEEGWDLGIGEHRGRPCEDTGRWQLSTCHGQGSQKRPVLPTVGPQTCSLQNCETLCWTSHPICGSLLWEPKKTSEMLWEPKKINGVSVSAYTGRSASLSPSPEHHTTSHITCFLSSPAQLVICRRQHSQADFEPTAYTQLQTIGTNWLRGISKIFLKIKG